MSAWGQSQKNSDEHMSSGLPLKADIARCSWHVSKVPEADPDELSRRNWGGDDALICGAQHLCVPKTLSELMTWWNRLSWRNDRAALFLSGRLGLTIYVSFWVHTSPQSWSYKPFRVANSSLASVRGNARDAQRRYSVRHRKLNILPHRSPRRKMRDSRSGQRRPNSQDNRPRRV